MIITNCRSSSIKTWDMCPRQWYIDYMLGWENKPGKAAIKGTTVHKVMEILALLKVAQQNNKPAIKTDFGKFFVRFGCKSRKQIADLTTKIYKQNTQDDRLKWVDRDLQDCIRWVDKILDGGFDPREKDIIEVEPFFEIEIMQPWAAYDYDIEGEQVKSFFSIKGTIDLVTKINNKTIEVIDYKTGKQGRKNWDTGKKMTVEEIKDNIQPRMYNYACCFLYPWAEQIIVTMHYLNDGGPFTVYFDKKDFDTTEEILKHYFTEIKNTQIPERKETWKCSKFCYFGRNSFEGTCIKPLQKEDYSITMCDQIDYTLQHKNIDDVTKNMCNGKLIDNLDRYNRG